MIQIKNSQLTNETVAVINKLVSLDINASTALKLSRILNELSSILETKIKLEKKILEKYALKKEDGNYEMAKNEEGVEVQGSIKISDMDAFMKEMDDFLKDTNTINLDKIKIENLGTENLKFSTKEIGKIEFLFE